MTTDIRIEDAPITPPPPRRNGWVMTLVTLTGVVVIGALVLQAVGFGIRSSADTRHATYAADVEDVTELDARISSGHLAISFADVEEATLEVTSSGWRSDVDWRFEVDGNRLVVREQGNRWIWPDFGGSRSEAELVLPRDLEGAVSAVLDVSAGGMEVDGDLADVAIDVSAGSLVLVGASTSLEAKVSAGDATVITSDPRTISVRVSAGSFHGTVTGAPPESTDVHVSAGDADLDLPDAAYAVSGGVSAGDRTIDVRTDPASEHSLHVQVSAGDATIGYSTD
ncbi:hypothetical protein [Pseudactinotalea sp.]|uniref:hypothetical protein n=1 Tax=Pseudactinotalea sp. TaxID=1926260 RepID=UPI003B3A706F